MSPASRRSATVTSGIMAAVRSQGSAAELAVRHRLWANGFRYRIVSKLPGKPDLVFPRRRVAVFIDGDLWHGNSWRLRGLPSLEAQFPTNTEWWVRKIAANVSRDAVVNRLLDEMGWTVMRFWESRVLLEPNTVSLEVATAVLGHFPEQFRCVDSSPTERRRLASVVPRSQRIGAGNATILQEVG